MRWFLTRKHLEEKREEKKEKKPRKAKKEDAAE